MIRRTAFFVITFSVSFLIYLYATDQKLTPESYPSNIKKHQAKGIETRAEVTRNMAATEEIDLLEPTQEEIIRALTEFQNFYRMSTERWQEQFDKHYKLAQQGNPESMFVMYKLLKVCEQTLSQYISTKDNIEKKAITDGMGSSFLEKLAPRLEPCVNLLEVNLDEIPKGYQEFAATNHYLEGASAGDVPSAVLIKEWQSLLPSKTEYVRTAKNLEKAVRTGDPTAMMYARDFYMTHHHEDGNDVNGLEVLKWQYASCAIDEFCNDLLLISSFAQNLVESEVFEIREFGDGIEDRIKDPTPFGFLNGRLPIYLYEHEKP